MLNIYPVILSFVTDVAELTPRIAHHDPDLARQLRRASSSVALNTAEAMYARGRSRTACFNIALREMRECHAVFEVAVLLRYLPPLGAALEDRIQRIIGTLYRLSFARQAAAR
jgi:four helix bundle protein